MDEDKPYVVESLDNYLKTIELALQRENPEMVNVKKPANKAFRKKSKSSFFVKNNQVMEDFFHDKVIEEQRSRRSKTYIMMSKEESKDWFAMFTLRLDSLDISQLDVDSKRELLLKGKSPENINYIACPLIEEIGKNSAVEDNPVHLDEIIKECIRIIYTVHQSVGGKLIILNSIDVPKVRQKYQEIGFQDFGEKFHSVNDNKVYYQPMFLSLDKLYQ